ncbi:hypothetical protein ONE63_007288 [Megalurothrips usitatus]|uniref:BEN domain-containing protein n=1 Tax=Megalurothrips usitatus TaxID=439358 RepID=A0AAV7XVP2_9NEOP|nr:hypothetical protein ONE63_007288 [Megalurothrips usitatus]
MSISVALVRFPREKTSFVVDSADIEEFCPQSENDFVRGKLYNVRWPILKRSDSSSSMTEELYEAHIVMLAVSKESLYHRALAKKVKLPSSFVTEMKKKVASSREKASTEDVKKVSKRSRSLHNLATAQAVKERRQRLLDAHRGGSVAPVIKSQTTLPEAPPSADGEKLTKSAEDNLQFEAETLPQDNAGASDNDSIVSQPDVHQGGGTIAPVIKSQAAHQEPLASTLQTNKPTKSANVQHPMPQDKAGASDDDSIVSFTNESKNSRERAKPCKSFKKRKLDDSDTSVDCSWVGTDEEAQSETGFGQFSALVDIQTKLARQQRECRRIETDLTSSNLLLDKWKDLFHTFVARGKELLESGEEKVDDSSSLQTVQTPVKRNLFCSSVSTLDPMQVKSNQGALLTTSPCKWKVSTNETNPALKSAAPVMSPVKRTPVKLASGSGPSTPSKDAFVVTESSCTAIEDHSPNEKKVASSSSQKKKKLSAGQTLGPNQQNHQALSEMLLKVLKGEMNLVGDGKGKVHLGNDVWVKEAAWKSSIAPPTISLSLTVKNAAHEIWGLKKCATFSVTGGKSPKCTNALKEAAPIAGVEVIYAIFRAKMVLQGVTNDSILEANVKSLAKQALREKFQDCGRKLVRDAEKAKKLAKAATQEDDE